MTILKWQDRPIYQLEGLSLEMDMAKDDAIR
jgi:hypothetical protein